jgi:hypothetical protein
MNQKEIEELEKKSIFSLTMNDKLKDSVINEYLTDLRRVVQRTIKRKEVLILVLEK